MSSGQNFNMLINDELFQQMFMQFLQTQASVPAPQAPSIESECTLDPEVFTGENFSIKQIYKYFKIFGISFNPRITLNQDCMPTPEARSTYIFTRTFGTAQGYIASKIQAKYYQDQTDVLQDLKNAFSDLNPEFYVNCKLIKLNRANRFFVEFYTKFSKYVACSDFNDKALKYHLKYALSEKLSRQLVSINLKDLTYYKLVQKCQTQNKQPCVAAVNTCKIMPRSQPPLKFNQQHTSTLTQNVILVITFKPATPGTNAIDLIHFKLTAKEKKH